MTVSVKSLQKQLIAAVAMVLVAMIALGSSTYAWFANNTKATATGLNVTATTAQSLLIDTASFTGYSTIAMEADPSIATAIWPTRDTVGNGVLTFKKATATDMQNVTATGEFKSGYSATLEDSTNDFFHDTFYLKLDGSGSSATETITVKPTLTYTGDDANEAKLAKAIHVAVIESGKTSANDFDMGADAITAQDLTTLTYNAANATQFEVYVYLDGDDTDCFNANIGTVRQFAVSLEFEIKTGA